MNKLRNLVLALAGLAVVSFQVQAARMPMMNHGRMLMDMSGKMVMGQNTDQLPEGCRRISEDVEIIVGAGHKYSRPYPGTMFGYSEHQWQVKPCARVTVTLKNDDQIRHQWMLHGLPEDLYPKGMFHIEVTGPGEVTGTFIVPRENKTYLVHCDIAQHTEKGMKAQLLVGKGSGTLPGIPGISEPVVKYLQQPTAEGEKQTSVIVVKAPEPSGQKEEPSMLSGMLILGLVIAILGAPYLLRWLGSRFFGMSGKALSGYLFDRLMAVFCLFFRLFMAVWDWFRPRQRSV